MLSSDREVRAALRRFFERLGVPAHVGFEMELAAGEALTNAIRYGAGVDLSWTAVVTRAEIAFELVYASLPFNPRPLPPQPDQLIQNGRGLLLMRSLTDLLEFDFREGEVRVSMAKRVGG